MSDITTHDAPTQRDFLLQLRPVTNDSRPATIRLRQALKLLLRACGLRCITCAELSRSARDDEPAPIGDLLPDVLRRIDGGRHG